MKFKVYADTEKGCEKDSIGIREDGAITAAFGRTKEDWADANVFFWSSPNKVEWTGDKGELLFEGEYDMSNVDLSLRL